MPFPFHFEASSNSGSAATLRGRAGCLWFRMVLSARAVLLALGICAVSPVFGQGSDGQGGVETLPIGTYIIPMDNTLQGNFNLKSYGLAVRLLHANVPLKWIINPTKGKDGFDFTANASRIKPTAGAAASFSFRAGPLAVHPGYESQALAVINAYGNNVAVYQLNAATSVNVDSTLVHKPKVAVFDQGGNGTIHADILQEAGLTVLLHYQLLQNATDIGSDSCFTIATEPHAENVGGATALMSFLLSGGNFFGQCAAVRSYTQQGVLAGFQEDGALGGSVTYGNLQDPMAQFEGALADEGGSVTSFKLTSNPGLRIAYSSNDGARYKAYVGRVAGAPTRGGWVHYLAGHNYNQADISSINGRRMLLNAVLRAARRPDNCNLSIPMDYGDWSGTAPVSNIVFADKLRLGNTVDSETSVTPNAAASADDTTGGTDDEDGVTLPASITTGSLLTIPVSVFNNTGSAAYLDAWIDFNNDSALNHTIATFAGTGERSKTQLLIPTSTSTQNVNVQFDVPSAASLGAQRGVRFRLSSSSTQTPISSSVAGEIEDYVVRICAPMVVCPAVDVLPLGTVGSAYSLPVTAMGGAGGFVYTVNAGSLPGGLTLGSSTGVISGSPTTAQTSTFTIRATDSAGCTADRSYTMSVVAAGSVIQVIGGSSQNNVPVTAASYLVNGVPASQSTEASGTTVLTSTNSVIQLTSLSILDSSTPKTLSVANLSGGTVSNVTVSTAATNFGVHLNGTTTSLSSSGLTDFQTSAAQIATNTNLNHYIFDDRGEGEPDATGEYDLRFNYALTTEDFIVCQERFGNSHIQLQALDATGNVIAGSRTVQVRGTHDWNTGYASGSYINTQPYFLTVIRHGLFGTPSPIFGFRLSINGADCKFFAMSENSFTDNPTSAGLIGDRVWEDGNRNGIQDANEPGLSGVTVRLLDGNGVLRSSQTTNASGIFGFTAVAPGNYMLEFVPPTGFSFSAANQGSHDGTDSDANTTTGRTAIFTMMPCDSMTHLDAGMFAIDHSDYSGFPSVSQTASTAIRIGTLITDGELTSPANAGATGDDDTGDDEDLTLPSFTAGTATSLSVPVTLNTSLLSNSTSRVGVYVDWNGDGDVTDTNETPSILAASTHGLNSLSVSLTPPAGTTTGTKFLRIRAVEGSAHPGFSAASTLRGEVEDYSVFVNGVTQNDLGDWSGSGAATTTTSSAVNSLLRLGASVDHETSVTPNANATADGADEDGVTMPVSITQDNLVSIPLSVFNNTGSDGNLHAWIDLNNDGTFNDALISAGGERLEAARTISTAGTASTQNITFTVPMTSSPGWRRGARFRLSSLSTTGPTGASGTGEVEDYVTHIFRPCSFANLVWQSTYSPAAPQLETYNLATGQKTMIGVTKVSGGTQYALTDMAWSPVGKLYGLAFGPSGTTLVFEVNPANAQLTQLGTLSSVSFNAFVFDEFGVPYVAGSNGDIYTFDLHSLNMSAATPPVLLYDAPSTGPTGSSLSSSGDLAWVGDDLYYATASGAYNYLYRVRAGTSTVQLVGAFTTTSGGALLNVWGLFGDGHGTLYALAGSNVYEVDTANAVSESFVNNISNNTIWGGSLEFDWCQENRDHGDFSGFGDASTSISESLRLGASIDGEIGSMNSTATADDVSGIDDENGFTLPAMTSGANATLNFTATNTLAGNTNALVNGWIDWNGNGTLSSDEKVITNFAVPLGTTNGSFSRIISVPAGLASGARGARFIITRGDSALSGPTGILSTGEVEDYTVNVAGCAILNTSTLPDATFGSAYTQPTAFSASGGNSPYTWSVTGMPAGMSFSTSTLKISGTPSQTGSFRVNVTVTDATGCSVSRVLPLRVLGCGATQWVVAWDRAVDSLDGSDDAGTWRRLVFTQNQTAGTLDVSATLDTADDSTDALWFSISNGPVPQTTSGNYAAVYLHGGQFRVTPYTQNPSQSHALPTTITSGTYSVTNSGTRRTFTFQINSTLVNSWAGGGASWKGIGFPLDAQGSVGGNASTPYRMGAWARAFSDGAASFSGSNWSVSLGSSPDTNLGTWDVSHDFSIACCGLTVSPTSLPNGEAGINYAQTTPFSATGGAPPYAFSVTSGLPPGLTLNSSTRTLTGFPTTAGTYNVVVQATDSFGCTGSRTYPVVISPCGGITIVPADIPDAYFSQSYTQSFTTTGTDAPVSWQIRPPVLPGTVAWWALEGNALDHAGSPAQNGTFGGTTAYTTGAVGQSWLLSGDDAITVPDHSSLKPAAITLEAWVYPTEATPAARRWIIGKTNSAATQGYGMHQLNGSTTVRFWVNNSGTAASVQSNMTLNAWNHLAGTYSTANGNLRLYINGVLASQRAYTTAITHSTTPLEIGRSPIASSNFVGRIDEAAVYNRAIDAWEIARRNAAFTAANGSYPASLSSLVSLWKADANAQDSQSTHHGTTTGTVAHAPGITGSSFDLDGVDDVVSVPHQAAHASAALTLEAWVFADETTPAANRWIAGKTGTGSNGYGLIQTAGTNTVRFFVNDAAAATSSADAALVPGRWNHVVGTFARPNLRIYVNGFNFVAKTYDVALTNVTQPFRIGSSGIAGSFFNGRVDEVAYYNAALTGGEVTARFKAQMQVNSLVPAAFTAGTVPAQFSGTAISPAAERDYDFLLRAQSSVGCTAWKAHELDLLCPTLSISASPSPGPGQIGVAYTDITLTASGGTAPYGSWNVISGSLPAGLSLQQTSSTTARISGTPNAAGTHSFVIRAYDANGCAASTGTIGPISITCPAITVTAGVAMTSVTGTAYTQTTPFSASGLSGSYVWTTSTLPAGITFDTATRRLSIASTVAPGLYNITVTATDSVQTTCSGSLNTSYRVCPQISLPATLPNAVLNQNYTPSGVASGGSGPYIYSLSGAPAWMQIHPTSGAFSGTPTSPQVDLSFTVNVADANGCQTSRNYTIQVGCTTFVFTPSSLPQGREWMPYPTTEIACSGMNGAFSITRSITPALPSGLTATETATGYRFTGTPMGSGTSTVSISITDSAGCSANYQQTIVINACAPITITPSTIAGATMGSAYSRTFSATGATSWQLLPAPPSGAVAGWGGEGSGLDHIGSPALNGMLMGGTSFTTGMIGQAFVFDGVDDTVSVPDNAAPAASPLNPAALSLEAWIYPTTATPAADQWIVRKSSNTAANGYGLVQLAGTANVRFWVNNSTSALSSASATLTVNQWNHIIGTYDAASNALRIYLNGHLAQETAYNTAIALPAAATPLVLGSNGGTSGFFSGRIDEAALYNRALNAPEVMQRLVQLSAANAAHPASPASATDQWRLDSDALNGISTRHGTLQGSPAFADGLSGSALQFDGVDDAVEIAHQSALAPAALSLEAWVLPDETSPTANRMIVGKTSNGNDGYGLHQVSGGQFARFWVNKASDAATGVQAAMTAGQWNHLAGTYDGATLRLYVNGRLAASRAYTTAITHSSTAFQIGRSPLTGSFFRGRVDEVLLHNSAISLTTVQSRHRDLRAVNALLPRGITFNAATPSISGTPAHPAAGRAYAFRLRAVNADACLGVRDYSLSMACPSITLASSPSMAGGLVGTAISHTITASGGTAPYRAWSIHSGALPPGVTLAQSSTTTALLSGTPSSSGTYSFTIRAVDANGCAVLLAQGPFTFTCPVISVTPGAALTSTAGNAFTQATGFSASGLTGIYTWTTGTLPGGFTFDAAARKLSTTTAALPGLYPITVTATDGTYTTCAGQTAVNFRVCPVITITAPSIPNLYLGTTQSYTFTGSDGTAGAITFDVVTPGSLPPGLTLSSAGLLSGAVTTPGTYPVTIRATNADGCASTLAMTFTVRGLGIGSRVFRDLNDNALNDDGVPGISGVTVRAYHPGADLQIGGSGANADTLLDTKITDSQGNYFFDRLPVGPVFIRVTPPAAPGPRVTGGTPKTVHDGLDNGNYGSQSAPGADLESPILQLTPGAMTTAEDDNADTDLTIDFGLWHGTGVGGLVWNDADGSGFVGAAENGISNVSVELWQDRNINLNDGAEHLFTSTTSDAQGRYSFLGIPSGRYQIVIVESNFASGALATLPTASPRVLLDNNVDDDSNGWQPSGQGHAAHSPIITLQNNAEPSASSTETGRWANVDDAFADSAGDTDVDLTLDFGFAPPGPLSVGNLVFNDNGGLLYGADDGEGVPDVPLQLFRAGENPALVPPVATTVTDSQGRYLFSGLYAGSYYIRVPASEFDSVNGALRSFLPMNRASAGDDDSGDDTLTSANPAANGIRTRDFALAEGVLPTAASGAETGFDHTSDDSDDTDVDLTIDIGLYHPVAVGNLVFHDQNNNGRADPGEGIAGVRVELYRDTDTPGTDTPLAFQTTNSSGFYLFSFLSHGNYVVHVPKSEFRNNKPLHRLVSIHEGIHGDDDVGEDGINTGTPSDEGVSSSIVPLYPGLTPTNDSGESGIDYQTDDPNDAAVDLTVDFGFQSPVGIGNLVFVDTNGNGRADNGEGIDGVTVELYTGSQTPGLDFPVYSTVTSGGGSYLFPYLFNGSYRVHIPAAMFGAGSPLHGTLSLTGADDTTSGRDDHQTSSDNGVDALAPANTGISSARVTLAIDTEPVTGSGETGAFKDLDSEDDNNFDLTIDFGFTVPEATVLNLGNLVFRDLNTNGRADSGEGIDGITVQLFRAGDDPLADSPQQTLVTQNGGIYQFAGLSAGTYFVFIPPSMFDAVLPSPLAGAISLPGHGADAALDDHQDENGIDSFLPELEGIRSVDIQLAVDAEPLNALGETGLSAELDDADDNNGDLTVDFGFFLPLGVGNSVFIDANNNSARDSGEGIANVTVQLFESGDNPLSDPPVMSTFTDNEGSYFFPGLPQGTYFLFIPPDEFATGSPLAGHASLRGVQSGDDNSGEDGIDNGSHLLVGVRSADFTLGAGTSPAGANESGFEGDSDDTNDADIDLTRDFGFVPHVTLGNLIFEDLDNDGIFDSSELGVPGITLELWDATGPTLAGSTLTDASGLYQFQCAPGTYYLHIPAINFTSGALSNHSPSFPSVGYQPVISADDDDAGQDGYTTGVVTIDGARTPVFTLTRGNQPLSTGSETGAHDEDDDSDDANGNLTIDLGFRVNPLSVGNLVFQDMDNDGIFDSGDTAIGGVTLRLHRIGDNPEDPLNFPPVATTISAADGSYRLHAPQVGDYFIHIPALNFASGAPLEGLLSSTGNTFDGEGDDNLTVENGIDSANPAATGINSSQFNLTHGDEPAETGFQAASDDVNDFDTDLTFDFGFRIPPPPAALAESRVLAPSNGSAAIAGTFAAQNLDPLGDEDHDGHTNLLEHALGTDPRSGLMQGRFALRVENGDVFARITRPVQTPDVRVQLEVLSADQTAWITQTNTLLPLPASAHGRARLRVELDADLDGRAEAVTRSETHAWLRRSLEGLQTFSMPLLLPDAARGIVSSSSGKTLQIALQPVWTPETEFYLELPETGERLEIDESASQGTQIVLDAGNVPAGNRFAIRAHHRIAALTSAPAFVYENTFRAAREDELLLPGQGVLLQDADLILTGQLRETPFLQELAAETQFIGSGFLEPALRPLEGDKLRLWQPITRDYLPLRFQNNRWIDERTSQPLQPVLAPGDAYFYQPAAPQSQALTPQP